MFLFFLRIVFFVFHFLLHGLCILICMPYFLLDFSLLQHLEVDCKAKAELPVTGEAVGIHTYRQGAIGRELGVVSAICGECEGIGHIGIEGQAFQMGLLHQLLLEAVVQTNVLDFEVGTVLYVQRVD